MRTAQPGTTRESFPLLINLAAPPQNYKLASHAQPSNTHNHSDEEHQIYHHLQPINKKYCSYYNDNKRQSQVS
jgi:hypothetical protein